MITPYSTHNFGKTTLQRTEAGPPSGGARTTFAGWGPRI